MPRPALRPYGHAPPAPDTPIDPTDPFNQIVGTNQAAEIIGVSTMSIKVYCDRGILAWQKGPGGARVYRRTDVEEIRAARVRLGLRGGSQIKRKPRKPPLAAVKDAK